MLEVLRFLGFSEVLLCSQVCSFWRKVADSCELWHSVAASIGLQCTSKQEFCGAYFQSFLFVTKRRLFGVYNCLQGTWKRIPIERLIHFSHTTSSQVVLPDGLMVICGGNHKHVYTYSLLAQELKEVQPMLKRRLTPGLCCDENYVFVFGGSFSVAFSSCEKLSLQSWTWSEMPDMLIPRARVVPCRLGNIIFLCGGTKSSTECEQYDILRNEFTFLFLKLTREPLFAVIMDCALVVITKETVYRNGHETPHGVNPINLNCRTQLVVLKQQVLFSTKWSSIYSLNMETFRFKQVLLG